ncbi:Crp/Fnr family transcriptional regulator [Flindersiella endophytica]
MSEVDLFADLSPAELGAIASALPARTYGAGELLYSPHHPVEALFLLKRGRVRIFRVSPEGRALTTALLTPGTIFGEMALVGQSMHDNFAEALDEVAVCLMSRAEIHRFMFADPRVVARLTEILGRRVAALERRLTDTVFKNVPQRVAGTLCLLATDQPRRTPRSGTHIALTHEQLAALVGTSRETTTKVLGEFAERGLVKVSRGRITLLNPDAIAAEAGD